MLFQIVFELSKFSQLIFQISRDSNTYSITYFKYIIMYYNLFRRAIYCQTDLLSYVNFIMYHTKNINFCYKDFSRKVWRKKMIFSVK